VFVVDHANGDPSRTIGVVLHPTRTVDVTIAQIEHWARANNIGVVGRQQDAARLPRTWTRLGDAEFSRSVCGLISLGGDGTMLGAMRLVASRPVPVLGVNLGTVGYLVETQPPDVEAALAKFSSGTYAIEPHNGLEITVTLVEGGQAESHLAFNDAVVTRMPGHGAVATQFGLRGRTYGYSKADGVISSTPAGSTAYNYSAGGPIVSPGVDAIVVTPVAPMAGISRPIVLATDDQFSLTLIAPTRQAALEIDGHVIRYLHPGDKMNVAYKPHAGLVARLNRQRHVASGMMKLSLLDVPLSRSQLNELLPDDIQERLPGWTTTFDR
jgi:NAD+ kinase